MALELVADGPSDVYFAGFGEPFQAGGDVDAVAVYVAIIGDHITGIDADAQPDAVIAIRRGFMCAQPPLYVEPAANRVCRAVEFDEEAVAHCPDQAAAIVG